MTTAPMNALKAKLAMGTATRGVWLNLASDAATEIAGNSGADWCVIDGEHAPFDPTTILRQIRVLEGTPAEAVVRVPVAEAWIIKQVLDMGVQTILVPMIDTAEAAREVVSASRYPPAGIRGVGPFVSRAGGYGRLTDYAAGANEQICVIVQAETVQAIENIEAIASVDGIDGIFIGPADLSADMTATPEEVAETINTAVARIAATGRAPGIFGSVDTVERYEALGARMTAIASDAVLMTAAMKEIFG